MGTDHNYTLWLIYFTILEVGGSNKFRYGLLVKKKIDIVILGKSEIEDEFHYVMIMFKTMFYITQKPILAILIKPFAFLPLKKSFILQCIGFPIYSLWSYISWLYQSYSSNIPICFYYHWVDNY